MKNITFYLMIALTVLCVGSCEEEGPRGPMGPEGPAGENGLDAEVYYSEWFSPTEWSGKPGDWFFIASAPDLTEDVVESGLILAYVWLAGDAYEGAAVRPLPAYAVGANWSFLISDYESIEFTCDMVTRPLSSENKFRFIAIPGNIPALKSASTEDRKEQLKQMSYQDVCKLLNIPE